MNPKLSGFCADIIRSHGTIRLHSIKAAAEKCGHVFAWEGRGSHIELQSQSFSKSEIIRYQGELV